MACFLNLPTEILLMISKYLEPAEAVALKNANKYLRLALTVKDPKYFPSPVFNMYYITIETWPEYTDHHFCFECEVFLLTVNFANDQVSGKHGKNGYAASRRLCISCGTNGGMYHPYDNTTMANQTAYYYRNGCERLQ